MIEVYHNPRFLGAYYASKGQIEFHTTFSKKTQLKDLPYVNSRYGAVYLVAEVSTDDLEEAFKLTNSIDTPWYQNPEVVFYDHHKNGGARSTSVGDVLVKYDENRENPQVFVVAPVGFHTYAEYESETAARVARYAKI